jgi:hypothetical protein
MTMFAIQAPITLFAVSYVDASLHDRTKKPIVVAALVLAILVGVIWGYWSATAQYKFL